MYFDYDTYYNSLVVQSGLGIIFDIFIFIIVFILIIALKKNNKLRNKIFPIVSLAMLFIPATLLITHVSQFNPKLIWDERETTIYIEGKVTDVKEIKNPPRMMLKYGRANPHYITIDNQVYYIMDIYEVQKGDIVTIEYLPNSKVILYVQINTE